MFDSAFENSLKNIQLYKEIIQILKKALLILAVGLSSSSSVHTDKVQQILEVLYDTETCTPKELLDLLEIRFKPEDFLKDLLFKADTSKYESKYSRDDVKKLKNTEGVLFNLYPLSPCLIDLPKNYLDFISIYFKARCGICGQVPSNAETALCLLCGEVLCVRKCNKAASADENEFTLEGNLSRHRRRKHAGNGLYLEASSLMLIMIFSNRSLSYMGLNMYCDSLGENIKGVVAHPFDRPLESLDFRRFLLKNDSYSYIAEDDGKEPYSY